MLRESLGRKRAGELPVCLLWGGETTVTVRGQGRGGRNQEVALAAFKALRDTEGQFAVAAVGTDGADGPTDAAGAWFDRRMIATAHEEGVEPDAFLENNDSYSFFARLGGLLRTGPTGTNVADLVLALAQ
jgi:hydroxypyruvate reductase